MKKNKTLRLASCLLIATLCSTCVISGTFAKYVSSADATATATVANWSIDVEGSDIAVNESIAAFNLAETWTDYDGSTEVDVEEKLLAPGTSGSFNFVITNNSEVDAKYSITLAESIANLPTGINETAFPVEYSADNAHWDKDITKAVTSGELAMNDNATVTVYWRWAFGGDDSIDTQLGTAETAPVVTVTAKITVEQVD